MFGRAMGSEAVRLPNKIVKSSVTHVNQKMCKFKVPTFEQKLISRRLQNIKDIFNNSERQETNKRLGPKIINHI